MSSGRPFSPGEQRGLYALLGAYTPTLWLQLLQGQPCGRRAQSSAPRAHILRQAHTLLQASLLAPRVFFLA